MVSCDIPAVRKICGHVSALVSCHRCQKKANYENHQHNFAGMGDMEDWFVAKDSNEHLQNALGWRQCNSDTSRKRFVKQTGVRWSELLRLPYFDPIRFTIVDPMHYRKILTHFVRICSILSTPSIVTPVIVTFYYIVTPVECSKHFIIKNYPI
ncbi:uncharacterized protein LOC105342819 [Rhizophagus irregularis DAOM 181602=DAOM 197198]|nr:uncharacterized protein LOC105342819 [Rhizophagus irregularis DAOM 181602=DAOM 197198]